MRPEFLKSYHIPLCSDALSNFSSEQTDPNGWLLHRKEVIDASQYLVDQQCAKCAANLIEHFEQVKKSNNTLVKLLHKNGINIRYSLLRLSPFVDQSFIFSMQIPPICHRKAHSIQSYKQSRGGPFDKQPTYRSSC